MAYESCTSTRRARPPATKDLAVNFISNAAWEMFCGHTNPASRIGSRTIDLGEVLSGESTSTVGSPSTVCINDDLTAGKTGVTLRATNNEAARGLDLPRK